MQIIRDFFGVVRTFEGVYERTKKIFIPPKAYSWQTLIYLSLFSWLMSSLTTDYIKNIIAFFGWSFLIAGTAWYTTDDPLVIPMTNMPVGAVLTGFLVSVFAFGNEEDVITSRTIVLWPTISAVITTIPEFFEGTGTEVKRQIPKVEERQKIIILLGSCMVISCWLQLYFVMDNWINEYPSLQVDNFQRSTFVMRTEPATKIPKNGVVILDKLTPLVEEQLSRRPWSEVEQWLINARQRVSNLSRKVIEKNLGQYEEKSLWRVEPRVSQPNPTNPNSTYKPYKLDLLSIWIGPSSNPRGYYLIKSCGIDPVLESRNTESETANRREEKIRVAEIKCNTKPAFFAGSPPPQQ